MLRETLKDEVAEATEQLAEGAARSYDDYTRMTSRIHTLKGVLTVMKEIERRYTSM